MIVAQISDCHITTPGKLAYDRIDTAAYLRRGVAALKSLPRAPDLILVTGDLVQRGQEEEYDVFRQAVAGLSAPLITVAGNHDSRSLITKAFDLGARFELQHGFVQYVVEDYPLRLIALDTVTEGSAEPSFCDARLAWLKARLAEDDRPTIIAMHHPPFSVGVEWMEPKDSRWADALAELVASHPAIVRVVCGHVHRTMSTVWAGTCAMSAPSTAHQVFPDLTPAAPRQFNFEAPGFLLHQWTGTQVISYGVGIPGLGDTFNVP